MKILVACEFSGIVRNAFTAAGHEAWSCDIEESETEGIHYRGDVRDIIGPGSHWDMMIAFPPCTYLARSGARWWPDRQFEQQSALHFVGQLMHASIPRIAIENPIGRISTTFRKPDQIVQPWQFGHGETKATCLWLYNLPQLQPTDLVPGRESRIHKMPPSATRSRDRSRTYPGIAAAMAGQWGGG